MPPVRIGLIGDYNPSVTAHQAIPRALGLADPAAEPVWVGTSTLDGGAAERLGAFAGLWCVPASPYANADGALRAIRFARETGRPFLGTCGGFQHALLEYARNVLGYAGAAHAEEHPDADEPLIAPLACSLVEQSGAVHLADGSRLRRIYGSPSANEAYHCRYGLNPRYERLLDGGQLHVCGRDDAGEVRAVELAGHPFFVATLFQPERAALRGEPHPLVNAFVAAAANPCGRA